LILVVIKNLAKTVDRPICIIYRALYD